MRFTVPPFLILGGSVDNTIVASPGYHVYVNPEVMHIFHNGGSHRASCFQLLHIFLCLFCYLPDFFSDYLAVPDFPAMVRPELFDRVSDV